MGDLPMRVFHTQFTKIKNIPENSPKRSDYYFESSWEQMLTAKFEHFKQYLNQGKPTKKC